MKRKRRDLMPDEPSDLDDHDLELMEAIVKYKARHTTSPYINDDAQYPKLTRISQKDVKHLRKKRLVQ